VECERLDTELFKVTELMGSFIDRAGKLFACGTCLEIRQSEGSEMCPLSTMQDLYDIVRESEKVITF
jgi:uncharacterized protein involved in oxidation of intracellular sulfur